MLRELYIKNFGIFAEERLKFEAGMSVVSGETGAGKSLVVGAIALVLGGRASSDDIRTGSDEAQIEAVFDLGDAKSQRQLKGQLSEMGFASDDDVLVIRRVLQANGRGRVFINGSSATVSQLASVGERLIDLSGQHEQQILMDEARHLGLLDEFAGHDTLLGDYQTAYAALRDVRRKLAALLERRRTAAERADFLRFRVRELQTLNLRAGEDEELRDTLKRVQHAQKLFDVAKQALDALSDGEGAVAERLGSVRRQLEKSLEFDPTLQTRLQEIRDAESILDETAAAFSSYINGLTFDPAERDKMEERLFKLSEVGRKYGSVAAAVEQFTTMQAELASLENVDGDIELATREQAQAATVLAKAGEALSASRRTAAQKLSKQVEAELKELAMDGARLSVELIPHPPEAFEQQADGLEAGRCLFSANRGEAMRPLAKVASGGELSRVLLAIKLTLRRGDAETYIFDEIDAGVGGRQAEVIGRKLKSLCLLRGKAGGLDPRIQVFCVTHLPTIAAYGDQHLVVSKCEEGGRTVARATVLTKAARAQEVARMLAGAQITEVTLAHAEEMLKNAQVS